MQSSVTSKLKDMMEKAVGDFPRLCYLSEGDMLVVMSNLGNPVPLLPILSRIFPAVSLIRFTEVAPSKNTLTVPTATSDEEGTILVVGWCVTNI